jgi:hypothetical protein
MRACTQQNYQQYFRMKDSGLSPHNRIFWAIHAGLRNCECPEPYYSTAPFENDED